MHCQRTQVQAFAELFRLVECDTRTTDFQFGKVGAAGGVGNLPLSRRRPYAPSSKFTRSLGAKFGLNAIIRVDYGNGIP